MARIVEASSELGKLLLKGWVMTDQACDECAIPLMRTPRNQQPVQVICVQCNTQNEAGTSSQPAQSAPSNRSSLSIASQLLSEGGISTPATDLSAEEPPLPELTPFDNEEILARRAQSDQASTEIGRRLLQGWAMLADECPRSTCYGIPLVRPPKAKNGMISKGKECVVCGTDYNPEIKQEQDAPHASQVVAASPTISPREGRATRDVSAPLTALNKGADFSDIQDTKNFAREIDHPRSESEIPGVDPLVSCSQAITSTIGSLTNRLNILKTRQPIQYAEIKDIAETISSLVDTLQKVRNASTRF